ncbi:MAG: alpha/beta fold hydrolase [Gammaproteobacteria bacterium]
MVDFVHAEATFAEVRLHYVTCGAGQPVVLLHGWPQTWYEWREVMAELAGDYRLIAPDLRGLGDSSRPADGYDTDTVASDIYALLTGHLDITRCHVVGHDWGGPVAFALAAQYPELVASLAIVDVAIPGDGQPSLSQGGRRWHHAFHQTPELPEALIAGREAVYLGWFYDHYGARPDAIKSAARAEYLRCYSQPGAFAAGLAYYRNIPRDIALNEAHLARGKLAMPVLALGGAGGWGRGEEVLASCRRVAADVRGGVIEHCGHWIPEEQPMELVRRLRPFFQACAIADAENATP